MITVISIISNIRLEMVMVFFSQCYESQHAQQLYACLSVCLMQGVMAVPILEPRSITAFKEEGVVPAERWDDGTHQVAVAGQKFPVI